MNPSLQYVNLTSMNILCFKESPNDMFYYCPLFEHKAIPNVKFLEDLPGEATENIDFKDKKIISSTDSRRGKIIRDTARNYFIPLPVRDFPLGKYCLPLDGKIKHDLKQFEIEKRYALKLREVLSQCNCMKVKPEIIVDENVDPSDLSNLTTEKIVCTKDELFSINYILEHKIVYSDKNLWVNMEDVNKLKILTGDTALGDREVNIMVEPNVLLKRDIETPIIFSRGSGTYLVQSTATLDMAIANCIHWDKEKVNLGYRHDKNVTVLEASKVRIFDSSDDGIRLKLESFVVSREHSDGEGFDFFSFFRILNP